MDENKLYKEVAYKSNINIMLGAIVLISLATLGIFLITNSRYIKEVIIYGLIFASLFLIVLGILIYNLMVPKVIIKASEKDLIIFWHNKWRTIPLSEIKEVNANLLARKNQNAKVGYLSISAYGKEFKLFCIKKVHQAYKFLNQKIKT